MKNAWFSLLLLGLFITSCSKDNTFSDQIVGKWHSVNVRVDGVDATSGYEVTMYILESKEFDATVTITPVIGPISKLSYTGDWVGDDEKEDLTLQYDSGEEERYDIYELTDASMRASVVVDGKRREIVFEKL